MLSEKIYSLRTKNGITQENLAGKLDVTRQSVQKWESYAENMDIEYRQCVDEGKDVAAYRDLFSAVAKMPASGYKDKVGETLFFLVDSLPTRADYEYCEPNDLNAIRMYRKEKTEPVKMPELSKEEILDKCTGGWYGRICGCLLGKPVEMSRMPDLEKILKRTNNYPISRYVDKEDVEKIDTSDITHDIVGLSYRSDYGMMPPDDDTNYIVIGYEVLRRHGRDFTSEGVADVWLNTQTKFAYATAERVAYLNLTNGYTPPLSGEYKNVYREWIGAQIRSDFYGYINPGKPEEAAGMAWRDARISHVKNGIYGSMWVWRPCWQRPTQQTTS